MFNCVSINANKPGTLTKYVIFRCGVLRFDSIGLGNKYGSLNCISTQNGQIPKYASSLATENKNGDSHQTSQMCDPVFVKKYKNVLTTEI